MLEKIKDYLNSKFGIYPEKKTLYSTYESSDLVPENNSAYKDFSLKAKNSSSRQSRNNRDLEMKRLRDMFMIGFRLFHAGDREEAISTLEAVLSYSLKVPTYRMVAACMIGETYRGMGNFDKADDYYELSIHESNLIPFQSQKGNEWYEHWRPRAQFGLITILRRNLSPNHKLIKSLLKDARDQYQAYPNQDLMAQLNVVEGVYYRQLGDVEGSIDRIKKGIESTLLIAPPYLFWHPEHFQAMLLLSYISDPGLSLHTAKLVKQTMLEERNPWSNAVSYAVRIHLFFNRIFAQEVQFREKMVQKRFSKAVDWFEKLNENALFEKDPFLTTETISLEIVWNVLLGKEERVKEEVVQLLDFMEEVIPKPILLLRILELATIKGILQSNQLLPQTRLTQLWEKGSTILMAYTPALISYGYSQELINDCAEILKNYTEQQNNLKNRNAESIQLLRLRLWP